jgi:DNA-binding winged helix-turn-helix (wHTH) protein
MPSPRPETARFGQFELDIDAGECRRTGRRLKLQPQPFKLLALLTRRAGSVVSREEIQKELWADGTFVDFDQAVNFAIKQIRDALGDPAERPLYIETVPRRGYRFIAPVETGAPAPVPAKPDGRTTVRLQKALWTNIAELRVADERRRKRMRVALVVAIVLAALAAGAVAFLR